VQRYNTRVCPYQIIVDKPKNMGIIEHMNTKYTKKQIAEFTKFCLRHELKFATIAEYNGAITQYFLKD
jgi:hypothetical protein